MPFASRVLMMPIWANPRAAPPPGAAPVRLALSIRAPQAVFVRGRGLDAVAGQQRALDLHEMDVGRIDDAGIFHRGLHGLRRLRDLRGAA